MSEYVNQNEFCYYYNGRSLNIMEMIKSLHIPNIPFATDFNTNLYRTSYGVTPSYWQHLSIMYTLINSDKIKKFISRNSDDLKILLLYIPIFAQKQFNGDYISLELIEDPDNYNETLRAYIHTSVSPSEASKRLDIIDDLTFDLETDDILDKFLLNVEFE